ncbi:MAG: hypothetical protein ACE5KD_00520 [Candidatus Bathyarchaeia archaeon]
MGKLEDLTFEKTDKGHLRVCGKMKSGRDVLSACVVVGAESAGQSSPISGEGHPEVQKELLKFVRENVKVR